MPNQPPLNSEALANLRLLADEGTRELRHVVLEPDLLHKLLDVAEQSALAAAEADRVKLESEALKLFNAWTGTTKYASWDEVSLFPDGDKREWLAVARAARELNKETGQ